MINNNDIKTTKTNLVIHRLNRQQYDELSSSKPTKLKEYELYLVDDDNYDVFNKKIINVGEPNPNVDTDGVNVGYVSTNYIKKNDIFNFVDKTKIYNIDDTNSLSADGHLYEKYLLDNDWAVIVHSGSYTPSQISVFYNGEKGKSVTDYGWSFNINNEFNIYTNDQNDNSLFINGEKEEKNLKVSATRQIHWRKHDSLVKKSEISACLSGINYTSQLPDVIDALLKLKNL